MMWLILGVTVSILAGGRARSQEPIANDVGRSSVPFPPTRVIKPGEPFPPAEVRVRRPTTPTAIELRREAARLDVKRSSVPFPPTRVITAGEVRVRRP